MRLSLLEERKEIAVVELTVHAHERILTRTRMRDREVLDIIDADAVVLLGDDGRCEFLLFYSPPDHCVKIALVSLKDRCLVSVWGGAYVLPDGVTPVNEALSLIARTRYEQFSFSRAYLNSRLTVFVKSRPVHKTTIGHIPVAASGTARTVTRFFQQQLNDVARLLDEHRGFSKGRVHYLIELHEPSKGEVKKYFTLSHEHVRRLRRASP